MEPATLTPMPLRTTITERKIASGGLATVKFWNASTGAEETPSITGFGSVFSVAFNHDSTKLVTHDRTRGEVVIWDVSTRQKLKTMSHTSLPYDAAWSPDSAMVASGHGDFTVKVWHASSGALIRTLTGHTMIVGAVAFSPDGTMIASGSDDDTVRVWDAPSPTDPHYDDVLSVAWSPDGTKLVSGSADNSVKIWNATSTAAAVKTLRGHTGAVYSAAFNDDGTRIASGSGDNSIHIWNASTGALDFDGPAGSYAITL